MHDGGQDFRTLELPQGTFVVLWEQEVEGRKLLAILPQDLAQGCLDALQEGIEPPAQPQVVAEMGQTLVPVPPDEAARAILAWTDSVLAD